MKYASRIQGRTPVLWTETKRDTGRVVYSGTFTPSTTTRSYVVTSGDWTADGDLYYVDIQHNKRSVEYYVQINDDNTGEDIWAEKINRRLNLDKCRIWLAYTPASITVILY